MLHTSGVRGPLVSTHRYSPALRWLLCCRHGTSVNTLPEYGYCPSLPQVAPHPPEDNPCLRATRGPAPLGPTGRTRPTAWTRWRLDLVGRTEGRTGPRRTVACWYRPATRVRTPRLYTTSDRVASTTTRCRTTAWRRRRRCTALTVRRRPACRGRRLGRTMGARHRTAIRRHRTARLLLVDAGRTLGVGAAQGLRRAVRRVGTRTARPGVRQVGLKGCWEQPWAQGLRIRLPSTLRTAVQGTALCSNQITVRLLHAMAQRRSHVLLCARKAPPLPGCILWTCHICTSGITCLDNCPCTPALLTHPQTIPARGHPLAPAPGCNPAAAPLRRTSTQRTPPTRRRTTAPGAAPAAALGATALAPIWGTPTAPTSTTHAVQGPRGAAAAARAGQRPMGHPRGMARRTRTLRCR